MGASTEYTLSTSAVTCLRCPEPVVLVLWTAAGQELTRLCERHRIPGTLYWLNHPCDPPARPGGPGL